MSEKIFLSYAHQDRGLTKNVVSALRRQGLLVKKDIEIFDPKEKLKPSNYIRETIKNQIAGAAKVVVIASRNMAHSPWVNYEIGIAKALGKPITVIEKKGIGEKWVSSRLSDVESFVSRRRG